MGPWILLLDRRHGRALEFRRTPNGRPRLARHDELLIEPEPVDDRQRLAPRNERHGMAASDWQSHEEEVLRRDARRAADWVRGVLRDHALDSAVLFCPTPFVGALRKQLDGEVGEHLDLRHGDLLHLDEAALLAHPALAPLLAADGAA